MQKRVAPPHGLARGGEHFADLHQGLGLDAGVIAGRLRE